MREKAFYVEKMCDYRCQWIIKKSAEYWGIVKEKAHSYILIRKKTGFFFWKKKAHDDIFDANKLLRKSAEYWGTVRETAHSYIYWW